LGIYFSTALYDPLGVLHLVLLATSNIVHVQL